MLTLGHLHDSHRMRKTRGEMIKTLFYVGNICFTMAVLLALWVSNGFQQFAGWQSQPVLPFVWGITVLALALALLFAATRFGVNLEARTALELWGRGSICGLMIGAVWAGLYLADLVLIEFETRSRVLLIGLGLGASVGLGLLAVVSEGFLRKNLVAMGWLAVFAGAGFVSGPHQLLGLSGIAGGLGLILTVTLVTGKITIRMRRRGSHEITREENPGTFWFMVLVLATFLALVLFRVVRHVFQ